MGRTYRGQDKERQKRKYLEMRKIRQTKRVENADEYGKPKKDKRQHDDVEDEYDQSWGPSYN